MEIPFAYARAGFSKGYITHSYLLLQLQTIKAIVDSCSFKSPKSEEPRRVQVLDLYCLTRFESESSSREIVLLKTSWRIVCKTVHYIYYTNVAAL